MNYERAVTVAEGCSRALLMAGPNAMSPVTEAELMSAAVALLERTRLFTVKKEDLNYQKRLYTALKARHAKLCKEVGKPVPDDVRDIAAEVNAAPAPARS